MSITFKMKAILFGIKVVKANYRQNTYRLASGREIKVRTLSQMGVGTIPALY